MAEARGWGAGTVVGEKRSYINCSAQSHPINARAGLAHPTTVAAAAPPTTTDNNNTTVGYRYCGRRLLRRLPSVSFLLSLSLSLLFARIGMDMDRYG